MSATIPYERPEWHRRAACRGPDVPVDIFYPERGESLKHARDLCAVCPVRPQCHDAGLREKYGIWGGSSERERRRLRRELNIQTIDDHRPDDEEREAS